MSKENHPPTVKSALNTLLCEIIEVDSDTKFQLQYVDYKKNEWTLPVQLLEYRISNFADDHSLKKVKLIFDGKSTITLNA